MMILDIIAELLYEVSVVLSSQIDHIKQINLIKTLSSVYWRVS